MTEPGAPRPVAPAELAFERIVYEKTPPRATITLNRPEVLNAFDFRMLRELARACEDASWDDEIRVVVLTGAGDAAFCAGADLSSFGAGVSELDRHGPKRQRRMVLSWRHHVLDQTADRRNVSRNRCERQERPVPTVRS